jgi:16S rRNA processing protein RimM
VTASPGAAERLAVGLVRGVHGLRGAVRVEILTDDASRFEPGSEVYPEGSEDPLTLEWVQEDAPGTLVRFREIGDRPTAETLKDRYLEVPATPGRLGEGEYYWHEVIGSRVVAMGGRDLGEVEDVFRAGGAEVLVVRDTNGHELLIPAVKGLVTELAPQERRIVVDADALDIEEKPRKRRPRGRRSSKTVRAADVAPGEVAAPGDAAADVAAAADTAGGADAGSDTHEDSPAA